MAKTYHHGDLRTSLISHAMNAVASEGLEKVSLRGLASEIGVSPSAVYHHFADKRALVDALCDETAELLAKHMRTALSSVEGSTDETARRRFTVMGETYIAFAQANRNLFLATFGSAPRTQPAEDTSPFNLLLVLLDELESRALLRPGIREGLELVVWSMAHGLSMLVIEGHIAEGLISVTLAGFTNLVLVDL